jgi:ABC-2 type transport system ATP-binding protein
VIVSSHLLSEVEQTCSHVIVMHRGRLVTRGRVDELMAGKDNMRLEDFFIEVVGDDLTVGK